MDGDTAQAQVTPEELVARAREMAPVLAERAAKADELRRIPDETIADFKRAGSKVRA